MSAIEQLKVRLTGLKLNRHKKEEDLALHEKCVLGIQAEINEATEEIREYESAITLLKEELNHTVEKHRSKPDRGYTANKQKCVEEDPYVPKFSGPRITK